MEASYLFVVHVPKYLPSEILTRGSRPGQSAENKDGERALFVRNAEEKSAIPPRDIKRSIMIAGVDQNVVFSVRTKGVVVTFKTRGAKEAAHKLLRGKQDFCKKFIVTSIIQVETGKVLVKYIREILHITTVFVTENEERDALEIIFHTDGEEATEEVCLELWDTLQVGRSFGSLHVLRLQRSDASKRYPACVPAAQLQQMAMAASSRGHILSSSKDAAVSNAQQFDQDQDEERLLDLGILHNEVLNQIRLGAVMSLDFILMTIVASLLAGVALAANNTVVVVASMLVSPLMGPILATVFGYVIKDLEMLGSSLIVEVLALLICVACGFVVGVAFAPWGDILNWPNNEMASRGTINGLFIGLGIAIPSGVGVALGILGGNTSSLVGVAISASLLPPAVNCGICWAYALVGESLVLPSSGGIRVQVDSMHFVELGGISLSLTILNILCIFIFAYLTFAAKIHLKYPGKTDYWGFLAEDILDDPEYMKTEKSIHNINSNAASVSRHFSKQNSRAGHSPRRSPQASPRRSPLPTPHLRDSDGQQQLTQTQLGDEKKDNNNDTTAIGPTDSTVSAPPRPLGELATASVPVWHQRGSMPQINEPGFAGGRQKRRFHSRSIDMNPYRDRRGSGSARFLGGGAIEAAMLRNPMNAIATADVRRSVRMRNSIRQVMNMPDNQTRGSMLTIDPRVLKNARQSVKFSMNQHKMKLKQRKKSKNKNKGKKSKSILQRMFKPPENNASSGANYLEQQLEHDRKRNRNDEPGDQHL